MLPSFLAAFIIKKEIKSIEERLLVIFDIIWNFDPSRFFNLNSLSQKLRICHLVDLNQVFRRVSLAGTSDLCFVTTDFIKRELTKHNSKTFKVGHGCQLPQEEIVQQSLPGDNVIKAVYVGNLTIPYIDWEILLLTIEQHSEIDFCFIGPYQNSNISRTDSTIVSVIFKLQKRSNVFFMGSFPSQKISGYLIAADMLMLVYKAQDYPEQLANPHKVMEYLASGKVTVATYTDEYKDKPDLLAMCKSNSEYPALFANVASRLHKYNSPEKLKKRRQFARKSTYKNRIVQIEQIIRRAYAEEAST